jgi:predicted short-subunit dehydrogenase-like oxidoreductase (DUF2520 family)
VFWRLRDRGHYNAALSEKPKKYATQTVVLLFGVATDPDDPTRTIQRMTRPVSPQPKPTVALIGAGRLGQALAIALQSAGYPIVALVARHQQKAEKAATLLAKQSRNVKADTRALALSPSRLSELPATDLLLLATPDDASADTARNLSLLRPERDRGTVLHTSGALSSEVLLPLSENGFEIGSIHPLVSISEPASGAAALHGAFFCIEGTRKAKVIAETIVRDLSGRSFTIKRENKALYHAAAVMAAPNVTALVDLALEMLSACGLSKRKAQEVFMPLLESTVKNLQNSNPQQALTGTFARGDIATVRRHLAALSGKQLDEALQVYKLLGLHSLQMAKKNGLDSERAKKIIKLLRSP